MTNISPDLLSFLKDLHVNNNKEWFDSNKDRYQQEELKLKQFGETVLHGLNQTDVIEKVKVYRIYRDVRFRKDKTPYKTNRALSFIREGVARRGTYYLNIESGNSFVAGGFFAPNPADLLRIRKEFEMDDREIREIMAEPSFQKVFGNEFVPYSQVKTAPKGFSKDHTAIDLIKNKSFFFQHNYTDAQVVDVDFSTQVIHHFKLLQPYFNLMSAILTTDLNGESIL